MVPGQRINMRCQRVAPLLPAVPGSHVHSASVAASMFEDISATSKHREEGNPCHALSQLPLRMELVAGLVAAAPDSQQQGPS